MDWGSLARGLVSPVWGAANYMGNQQKPKTGALQDIMGMYKNDPFRQQQQGDIDALRRQAEQGDPYAREQLRQQTGRLMGMQQGMQQSATPSNQAMMARLGSQNAGMQQSGMAGQAAQADVAARLGAMQQLTGATGQARGQDMQRNAQMAQLQQVINSQPGTLDYLMQILSTGGQLAATVGGGPGAGAAAGGFTNIMRPTAPSAQSQAPGSAWNAWAYQGNPNSPRYA